ncbi:hypothetical protein VHEMI07932 [[Torrubiella] hemipterigena]|uniref:Zn(2)-C6 fungal-type domain-containing protein n=1 Tax=[Torrubiella] hemipterigena TaxID=1531966 RepID=A0A0A1T539_9HYPO|nr:hypothetical protein VHEMI07932 [[Torrubiella] hemipterigena]
MPQQPTFKVVLSPLVDSGRRKKFVHRSRTGCLTCRQRRVKCDEQHPACKRCTTAKFKCDYQPSPEGRQSQPDLRIVPQPSAIILPEGAKAVSYEINLFGTFRDTLVTGMGGPFNHRFWRVDVPTAAQIYPSLWHSAIAIASIDHSTKVEKKRRQLGPDDPANNYLPSNHHYIIALTHFNKSIRSLARSLAGKSLAQLSYIDKEMVLMTNILFIGICSMLEETGQLQSHYRNFKNLLSTLRFGKEESTSRKGIMSYEDLLAVILSIDGSLEASYQTRWLRSWVVDVPCYPTLQSVTQAYTEFLPIAYSGLNKKEDITNYTYDGPLRGIYRQNQIAAYEAKLTNFLDEKKTLNSQDLVAIESIRIHLEVMKRKEEIFRKPNRAAAMKYELGLFKVLDHMDSLLSKTTRLYSPYSDETAPMTFAPSLGSAMELMAAFPNNAHLRRKAIELMRKWPFKENGTRSKEEVVVYEIILRHLLSGPERTKHWQKKGIPIHPTYPNGGLNGGEFNGLSGCECIYELYICRDHRLGSFTKDHLADPPRIGLMNVFERRNELGYTWVPLQY